MAHDSAENDATEDKDLEHVAEAETAEQDQYPDAVEPSNDANDVESVSTTKTVSAAGSGDHAGVTESDEDISTEPDDGTRKRRWRHRIFAKAVAAVIVVTILAGAAVLGWMW